MGFLIWVGSTLLVFIAIVLLFTRSGREERRNASKTPLFPLPMIDNMTPKPKKPLVAGILSLLIPGFGQLYCGKVKRGTIIFLLVSIALPITGMIAFLPIPLLNVLVSTLLFLSITLFVVVDAVIIARRIKTGPKIQGWGYLIVFIAWFIIGASTEYSTRTLQVRLNTIASRGMISTLLVGDQLISDRFMHRYKSLKRGDIVLFKNPEDKTRLFVQRIIGLPGEKLEIKDQTVFINDRPLDENGYAYFKEPPTYSSRMDMWDNFEPTLIPEKNYFLMGDNRVNSHDSRFFGPVDIKEITGTARTLYWSWDPIGNRVRWERIGMVVK